MFWATGGKIVDNTSRSNANGGIVLAGVDQYPGQGEPGKQERRLGGDLPGQRHDRLDRRRQHGGPQRPGLRSLGIGRQHAHGQQRHGEHPQRVRADGRLRGNVLRLNTASRNQDGGFVAGRGRRATSWPGTPRTATSTTASSSWEGSSDNIVHYNRALTGNGDLGCRARGRVVGHGQYLAPEQFWHDIRRCEGRPLRRAERWRRPPPPRLGSVSPSLGGRTVPFLLAVKCVIERRGDIPSAKLSALS